MTPARALVLACLYAAISIDGSAQEPWRTSGLASFDEAWQTIADTYYDPTFGGLDWGMVRAELRPKAESASSADEIRTVIAEMLARLERSHFALLSSSDIDLTGPVGEASVQTDVRIAPEGLIVTFVPPGSPAARAGLAAGQRILAIDGTDTADWNLDGTGPAARRSGVQLWRRARRALHGEPGSTATLIVESIGRSPRRVGVVRTREAGEVVTFGNLPRLTVRTDVRELRSPAGRRVGVIAFNVWMTAIDAPVAAAVDAFRAADGLVIDLRGNPGGLAAMMSGIAGHLVADADVLLGRMQTRQAVLEFRPNPRTATADGHRVQPYAGPAAILVDELSGSTSECFAGALQAVGRARVFGRQTMGEALPALTKRLANGDVLMHAVGNFLTATGRSLEGDGVIPDELVALSPAALARGEDRALDAALAWFDRQPRAGDRSLLK